MVNDMGKVLELYQYISKHEVKIYKFNLYIIKYDIKKFIIDLTICSDYAQYKKIWNILYFGGKR